MFNLKLVRNLPNLGVSIEKIIINNIEDDLRRRTFPQYIVTILNFECILLSVGSVRSVEISFYGKFYWLVLKFYSYGMHGRQEVLSARYAHKNY